MDKFKTAIRPGLAIWSASMLSLSFVFQLPMEVWLKAICFGCLAEWIGERGIKKAKEMFSGSGAPTA